VAQQIHRTMIGVLGSRRNHVDRDMSYRDLAAQRA
jgi:hypothetical protein